MKPLLTRLIAAFLAPCLLLEPALAFAQWTAGNAASEINNQCSNRFTSQAVIQQPLNFLSLHEDQIKSMNDQLAAGYWEASGRSGPKTTPLSLNLLMLEVAENMFQRGNLKGAALFASMANDGEKLIGIPALSDEGPT